MSLTVSNVSKCLDKKLMIWGFEVPDLLAIFFGLSILQFLFGQSGLVLELVWFPTLILSVILRYGKRGKPDNYLIHWLRFQFSPGVYQAFDPQYSVTNIPHRSARK